MIPCRKSRSAHFWDSVGMFCRSGDPCDPCDLCAWPTGSHPSANLVMWWDIPRWQMLRNAKCEMQFSQIDSFSGWMMGHDATILWIYMILYASMYANNLFYREPESSWHARLVVLPYHFRSFPRQFNCKQHFRSKCQVSMLKHLILV